MRIISVVSSLVLVACASPAAESSSTAGTLSASCKEAEQHDDLTWIQANIFDVSCAFSSCHSAGSKPAGGMSLTAGNSHHALVGAASTQQPGWKRVVAGDSGASYLMVAVGSVAGPLPMSGTMPADQDPLCDQKLDAIARWIDAGARP